MSLTPTGMPGLALGSLARITTQFSPELFQNRGILVLHLSGGFNHQYPLGKYKGHLGR